jgi:uncharacterized protein (DUF608 family)
MPLGGIGTGSVALCGDGSLRQWQLNNNVNHLAFVPHSFFAIRAQRDRSPAVARVLQSGALYQEDFPPVPSVNDYVIPAECRRLLEMLPGVQATEFVGEYPIAEVNYRDEALPVEVTLNAYSPFCPLDAQTSGLPAVVFRFTVRNPSAERGVSLHIAATLQNFVGWDGIQNIVGVECPRYGGNQNHALRLRGLTAVTMENVKLPANHPNNGTLCLATLNPNANVCTAWQDLSTFWNDFTRNGPALASEAALGPTPDGRTVNGALSVPMRLEPGEEKTITFVLAWHFPNRYVSWGQGFSGVEDRKSLFWQGNAYNARFADVTGVIEYVRDHFEELDRITRTFRDTFFDSTLPAEILDTVSSQLSIIRTPTCLWTEDGRFHAFEGCGGASTGDWLATGGCCPLNCTHVWNYEMSLAALFPDLERTMRETDLFHQLHPTGYLPHRTTLPLYLPRPWERGIGGPHNPALDGLLGMVLKTYREHKRCADPGWLERAWPQVKKAMHHVMTVHDSDGDGVIKGEQPNTYDISIYGPNTFIGTLYLAALRASEEMALLQNDPDLAAHYRKRFEQGQIGYDDLLWNGEFWIQIYDPEKNPEQNYGKGCHSDHLLGQWWAYVLDLGPVLPPERLRQAVQSIIQYNFRENFYGHKQVPRIYASDDEAGLLICSWPHGGRPAVPTLYSDEIWTGIEYEVAALCLYSGLTEEALALLRAVRHRYNGERRNPWNDVECGDHYARALSSWALLDAACGYDYDASTATLTVAPRLSSEEFRAFFLTASAWGTVEIIEEEGAKTIRLHSCWGELKLNTLRLTGIGSDAEARIGNTRIDSVLETDGELTSLHFASTVSLLADTGIEARVAVGKAV